MHMDELCDRCGYFESDTEANSGYGCNHPDQEERVDKDEAESMEDPKEEGQGKCFGSSCPIASTLSPNDEPEDRKYFGDEDEWKCMTDEDWMLIHGKFKSEVD